MTSGQAQLIEQPGDVSYVYLQVEQQTDPVIARLHFDQRWQVNDLVYIDIAESMFHLFDATGLCLSSQHPMII